ncbi:MAG: hypothetical protein KBC35_04495 [Candidatus Pacebacteria bacterium]|jgi:hypothetical protein|nr:hypothetical protein [Candidatus Paceibacterota bacterium]
MKIQDLTRLFWDVADNSRSTLSEKEVIARTMSHGTFAEIKELLATHDKENLQAVFLTLKPEALSKRRCAYFSLILS